MSFTIRLLLFFCVLGFTEVRANGLPASAVIALEAKFNLADFGSQLPSNTAFTAALRGYNKLLQNGEISKPYLSIIDFNLSANKERMWVLDMKSKKVVFHTLVAHGRNSGEEFATQFSNLEGSFQSSLGFYKTANTYIGKHGKSLKLFGLERNINDAAFDRGIVIHGADYVSKSFIQTNGRLGRSQGCPAVPVEICEELIDLIKDGSCLFIYKDDANYLNKSDLVKEV